MTLEHNKRFGKPVALIGMMGTGKTHVGEQLARLSGRDFIDTDALVVQQAGKTIARIFAEDGEPAFRALEAQVVTKAVRENPQAVIATGGGCVTNPEILSLLKAHAYVCWLQASPDQIYERVKNDTARPLLKNDNPRQVLEDLLKDRESLYAQAHLAVDTEAGDAQTIARTIIKLLSAIINQDKP